MIVGYVLKCDKCGHVWMAGSLPKACASCKQRGYGKEPQVDLVSAALSGEKFSGGEAVPEVFMQAKPSGKTVGLAPNKVEYRTIEVADEDIEAEAEAAARDLDRCPHRFSEVCDDCKKLRAGRGKR
jgi:hypothetical protein